LQRTTATLRSLYAEKLQEEGVGGLVERIISAFQEMNEVELTQDKLTLCFEQFKLYTGEAQGKAELQAMIQKCLSVNVHGDLLKVPDASAFPVDVDRSASTISLDSNDSIGESIVSSFNPDTYQLKMRRT
jgi:hypothetical protein